MAWLQADPSGNYHVSFRFGGRKFKQSLRTKSGPHAEGRRLRLEENIRLVESGRLVIPAEADVPMFLLSDGKLDKKVVIAAPLTLSSLFESYLEVVSTGHLEETTIERRLPVSRFIVVHICRRHSAVSEEQAGSLALRK